MKWTTSHHTYWNSKAVFPVRTVILYVCMCAHVHLQLEIRTDLKLYPQQFSSVAQSCPILCDPMNFQQARPPCPSPSPGVHSDSNIHLVCDAIQPSHSLSSPSPPAPNPSQHQSLCQWVNSSHEVAKVLEFQLRNPSLQRTPRTDLL